MSHMSHVWVSCNSRTSLGELHRTCDYGFSDLRSQQLTLLQFTRTSKRLLQPFLWVFYLLSLVSQYLSWIFRLTQAASFDGVNTPSDSLPLYSVTFYIILYCFLANEFSFSHSFVNHVAGWGIVRLMAAQLRVQSLLRGLWALLTCTAWGTTYYSQCQLVTTSTIVKCRWHWICSVKQRYTKYLGF